MKSTETLPQGYKAIYQINIKKDKKLALLLNLVALAILTVMLLVALPLVPMSSFWQGGLAKGYGRMAVLLLGLVAYIFLHEAVHGVFMRRCCTAKVRYGFTGLFAYAGSDGYYCRKDYIVIALAPVVIWGIVLAVLNAAVPREWFYVVYLIQANNIGGAAGDMYMTWKMGKMPADILVQDTGLTMTVFGRGDEAG
ncbi:MAG: DUF3267 domain-containing protein [Ruminococcaceae bacterium]|nr:DUF3267 domain-containing protein [Oscillospiraceae bacterium]